MNKAKTDTFIADIRNGTTRLDVITEERKVFKAVQTITGISFGRVEGFKALKAMESKVREST